MNLPSHCRRSPVLASLIVLLGACSSSPTYAQTLVDGPRASQLKVSYPFVRFSTLSTTEAVNLPLHALPLLPRLRAGEGARAIPGAAMRLNGRRVAIRGYMVPLDSTADGVSSFILSSSIDSCHFGLLGGMTDWVHVKVRGDVRIPSAGLSPITVFGIFSAGEEIEAGYVKTLYRLTADYVALYQ
jgi:hypothetical protein